MAEVVVIAGIALVAGFALGLLEPIAVVGIGAGIYGGPTYLGLLFAGCALLGIISFVTAVLAKGARGAAASTAALCGCLCVGILAGNAFASTSRIGFASVHPPVPAHATGSGWTTTANMLEGRTRHTATLLGDGRVLVAGGWGTNAPRSSAEVYDPATATWSATGGMAFSHQGHSAIALADGRVLLIDGNGPDEVYDPATGTWSQTASMIERRGGGAAVLLADGRVMVSGGPADNTPAASVELWDPATGAWTAAHAMREARSGHTATVLGDGRVLVAGGRDGTGDGLLASAELYDPATGKWTATGSLAEPRQGHVAMAQDDGTVWVVGGTGLARLVESYDPATGRWSTVGVVEGLLAPQAVALPGDRAFLVDSLGNIGLLEADGTAPGLGGNTGHGAGSTETRLPDGTVLVAGGSLYGRPDSLGDAHLYHPR